MNTILGGVLIMLLTTGCINISTRFQPDDLTVKDELEGSDCVPIIFSIGIGTADIEQAKLDAKKVREPWHPHATAKQPAPTVPLQNITKVRRIEVTDIAFLFFGAKCVDVVGEP